MRTPGDLKGVGMVSAFRTGALLTLLTSVLLACGPRTTPYATAPNPAPDNFARAVPVGNTAYSNESLANLFADLTMVRNGEQTMARSGGSERRSESVWSVSAQSRICHFLIN